MGIGFFADDDIFTNVDNFWSDFTRLIERRSIPAILMNTTLEGACTTLRENHPLVNGGQLIEEPGHIIYGHMFRSVEWFTLMRDYWKVYELEECVPPFEHVTFLIERILQSARDLTLAIRLKNDFVANDEDRINEVILVRKIVDRFFNGTVIANDDDIPMWAAVHSLFYNCGASTLAKIALNNSDRTRAQNKACMSTGDCDRLAKTMQHCDEKLPELKSIKEHGWNVFFAEALDPQGDLASHRDKRLIAMREWHQWANSPYDEQRGLSGLPQDRRGRKYRLSVNNADEFPTPHPNYWPSWSKPSYLQYFASNHSRTIAPKSMPKKAEPVVASGAQGTPPTQHAFFDPRFNAGAQSSGSQPQPAAPTACEYDAENDPWSNYGNDFAEGNESTMTTEPGFDNASAPDQAIIIDHVYTSHGLRSVIRVSRRG